MYTTPYNDAKFPKNLSKTNFIANVLPEINTYISVLNGGTYSALADWDTEA